MSFMQNQFHFEPYNIPKRRFLIRTACDDARDALTARIEFVGQTGEKGNAGYIARRSDLGAKGQGEGTSLADCSGEWPVVLPTTTPASLRAFSPRPVIPPVFFLHPDILSARTRDLKCGPGVGCTSRNAEASRPGEADTGMGFCLVVLTPTFVPLQVVDPKTECGVN
ncbi:hypothetical protein WA026_007009 [Henosepilachna vigintioctopunctata]|uniref:Uncharacterized protein n=1 Tax=Henosepilachna vigintioctopunctata TaxID=420089 RepID=A0AAW1VCK6_9CUCU